jgi:Uma2 family endonuclease
MNAIFRPSITPDEFELMQGVDHMELVDGVIQEKSMGFESSFIQLRIGRLLSNFVEEHRLGMVFDSEAGYRCFRHRTKLVRKPDVSFVRTGRFPNNRPPLGFTELVPDLVVEVVSPKDLAYDISERLNDFLLAGVQLVWVVDPHTRTVQTYQPDGVCRRYSASDVLPGEPVLSGFRAQVADFFPPPLPLEEPQPEPSV